MSLLGKIGKGLKRVVKKVAPLASAIPGPIGAAASVFSAISVKPQPQTLMPVSMGSMASLPAILGTGARVLPGLGRIAGPVARVGGAVATGIARRVGKRGLQIISKRMAKALGYISLGGLVYDAAGNLVGEHSSRRMNPLNHRALNRAIRRVCSAKKISKKIEKLTGTGGRRAARCSTTKRCK